MIKLILLLFLINSCASIDYSYFEDFKNFISRNEILIDQSFINEQKFSFIKVSNSRNDAIFVLSNINEFGIYEWVGSNYERIKTKDGLIVETQGLQSDIKFYFHDFSVLDITPKINSYIDLYNPDLIYESIVLINTGSDAFINQDDINTRVIEYQRYCSRIGWKAKDIYTFKDNIIYNSVQQINPFMEPLEITFYFKF